MFLDVGIDEFQVAFHVQLAEIGGQKQMVALLHFFSVQLALAGENADIDEGSLKVPGGLAAQFHPVDAVVLAGNQMINGGIVLLVGLLLSGRGNEGGMGHVQALLDVQLAGLAVLQTAVVIETVGYVAALLGFQDQGAALDGMQAAGIDIG